MNQSFKNILKSFSIVSLGLLNTQKAFAQNLPSAESANDFSVSVNDVLALCASLLLIVILVLGFTLRSSVFFYHEKRKNESQNSKSGTILSIALLATMFFSNPAVAQNAAAVDTGSTGLSDGEVVRWLLIIFIAIEMFVIFQFAKMIRFFTGVQSFDAAKKKSTFFKIDLNAIWTKMNKLKPIEEEASIDTGHSYDGIRELNNVTPPWFIAGFALSILFAIIYLWRYHVSETAPLQLQEYKTSVVEAKIKIDEYLKTQANNVDENTVAILDQSGIDAGFALFTSNCVACHGDKGQGAAVGPNLSDNYWLHKGSIKDVFKSIKYGWPEKGMKSWKEDLSATQIAQLASYISSISGTNIAGGKEPQGELYEEVAAATTISDSTSK